MQRKDRLEQIETCQEKKTWITPEIFDSPVIAVTEGVDSGTSSSDQLNYS